MSKKGKQTFRQKLREDAAADLDAMVRRATRALLDIASGKPILPTDLGILVADRQAAGTRKRCIAILAAIKEKQLLSMYDEQRQNATAESTE